MKRIVVYDVKLVKESSKMYELEDAVLNSSAKARDAVETVLDIHDWTVEKFGLLCVDAQLKVIGVHIVCTGTMVESLVDIRGIFQRAILNNAHKIIVFHNHPSGSKEFSRSDIDATNKIKDAGKLLGIELVDHILVYGEGKHSSAAERGLI